MKSLQANRTSHPRYATHQHVQLLRAFWFGSPEQNSHKEVGERCKSQQTSSTGELEVVHVKKRAAVIEETEESSKESRSSIVHFCSQSRVLVWVTAKTRSWQACGEPAVHLREVTHHPEEGRERERERSRGKKGEGHIAS